MSVHRTGKPTKPVLRSTAARAFGWSLLNTVVTRIGTLGIGIVLARVLGPEQFGTFAIAMVALMAVLSFNELGVSLAIVRWPGNPASIAPTVNTISMVASAIFCASAWIAAPLFTEAMGDPEATTVVRLLVLSVLINGLVASPAALLQRDFRERTRMGIDLVNVWVGTLLSLVLALAGMGAMALAIGRLAGSVVSGILFLRASPLPYRFGWNRLHVAALLRFGVPLAGSSIIVFTIGYSDQLAAGSMLGATVLGFYVLAFNLSSWPVSIVSQPLRRVVPAAFSAIQSDQAKLRESILALFGVLSAATIPAFLVLAGAAQPIVGLVYGEQWLPAASALSWLVVAALVKVFCELIYDYMVVIGRTGTVFSIQVVSLIFLIPALYIGASMGGIAGLAAAQACISALVVLPLYLWQIRRTGVRALDVLSRVWSSLLCGLVAGLAAWFAATFIGNSLLALSISGFLALASICGLLYSQRRQLAMIKEIGTNTETAANVP